MMVREEEECDIRFEVVGWLVFVDCLERRHGRLGNEG